MPKRSSKRQEMDPNVRAFMTLRQVIESGGGTLPPELMSANGSDGKNPAAVALGRLGGMKGGPARAKALGKSKRRAIAKRAARARWRKAKRV